MSVFWMFYRQILSKFFAYNKNIGVKMSDQEIWQEYDEFSFLAQAKSSYDYVNNAILRNIATLICQKIFIGKPSRH